MRPVNKGKAPEVEYKDYKDAEPELEERLGAYCSYCEMPINHAPEVANIVIRERELLWKKEIKKISLAG